MNGLINFGAVRPELANAFAAGYEGAELARQEKRAANQLSQQREQQLEMGQFDLEQARADRELMRNFQSQLQAAGKDTNLDSYFDMMVSSGRPDLVEKGLLGKEKLRQQRVLEQREAADRAAAAREQAVIQGIISGQGMPTGANALATGGGAPAAPVNALAAPPSAPAGASIMTPEATAAAPVAPAAVPTMSEVVAQPPTQADQLLNTISQLRQAAAAGVKGAATAADQLQKQYDLETKQSDPTKRFLNVGNGVVFDTQTQSYIQNPEGKAKTGTPVAVLDEESGSVVLVSPEEAIGRTPGSQAEKIPKDFRKKPDGSLEIIPGSPTDMKNKENASVGVKTIDAAIGNIDKLIGPVGNLKEHPGLRSATGPIDVKTPTLFESTANAEAYIQSLQAKASLEGLRTIRGQAGAIGQITEKEWPRLENLLATLQASQGTDQFIQSLNEYREALLDVKRQISAAEAAGGGGTNIDALLDKYK